MRVPIRVLAAMTGLAFTATAAAADPLTISGIGGGWLNPAPAGVTISNQAGSLVDTIRWGIPSIQEQSAYDFDPIDGAFDPVSGTPFLLGTFTHHNEPVAEPWLTSVDYTLSFSTNGVPAGLVDTFTFIHNETVNSLPCPSGPPGSVPSVSICDDFVSVSQLGINTLITVGLDTYYFNLLGFSTDGGKTIKNLFQTVESQSNSAGLWAVVTKEPRVTQVPEPGLTLLLTIGGVAALRRRRRLSVTTQGSGTREA